MKCPNCNAEVRKGSLYCDKCLSEIPWVKEFSSIETLMEKKKLEEPVKPFPVRPKAQEVSRTHISKGHIRKLPNGKWKVAFLFAWILVTAVFVYHQLNTFSSLYQRADRAYAAGSYDAALSLTERALDKKPDHLNANLLRAKILEAEGDTSSAILVLQPVIKNHPDSIPAYKMMLRLLYREGRISEIKKLMASCQNQEVLDACSEYTAQIPASTLASGTYIEQVTIELTGQDETIYYTMDGTNPTENSLVYSGPITLPEGTTVLKAMGVNQKGISSKVSTWKYILVFGVPNPPKISPKDGTYNKKTKIELVVPDGCVAYYAFDEEPTVNSTQYQNPISMPAGYHEFYAVLEGANGEVSEPACRIYYLEY